MKYVWKALGIALLAVAIYWTVGLFTIKEVKSPSGNVCVRLDGQELVVTVTPDGGEAVEAVRVHIGLVTEKAALDSGLVLKRHMSRTHYTDRYEMLTGKRRLCTYEANERTFTYEAPDGGTLKVQVRVSDDGFGFRYILPEGETVTEERTAYRIPDGTKRWISPLHTDYEAFFPEATDGKPARDRWAKPGTWAYPALYEPAEGIFALISEANLRRGDSGSTLDNSADPERYTVKLTGPSAFHDGESPWRLAIVGSLADIVESTLVTDLSDWSPIVDKDWIRPGVSSWVYWAYNHGSKDFHTNCAFIDLAAEMGWPYCLVDWEWPQMENGNIDGVLAYAKEKGVTVNLWYNSGTSWVGDSAPQPQDRIRDPEQREKELAWLEEAGVGGIKVDFFNPDAPDMVDYYLDILEDAARHHLLVDFHGCTIPRGWQRTWPNLMSMESVYGAEWYNNGPMMTPRAAAHNATLPFTRNVIGPMDYTPGTFSDSQFPHVTTYAHELALPILFESGLQHMPDRPEAYEALPAEVKELLAGLPSAWDDTRLLSGYPADHAVIARVRDGRRYVAGVNGLDEARDLTFEPEPGKYVLFRDGGEDRSFEIEDIEANGPVTVPCRGRGGFVMVSAL